MEKLKMNNFAKVIECLNRGGHASRMGWNENREIVKQIPQCDYGMKNGGKENMNRKMEISVFFVFLSPIPFYGRVYDNSSLNEGRITLNPLHP